MEFRILGPLEVVDGGRPIALGGARQRALLALLLTRANEIVASDRLIDELWGARPPAAAHNALQYHVSQLRKTLAPCDAIVTREPGYLLRVAGDELDLLRFEQLLDEAQRAPTDRAARLLRDALGLWRGAPLADLAYEPFAQAEILRLEELRLVALERRIDADLTLGSTTGVVAELEKLVREHPLRERFRGQLMQALYRAGRQADALELYRATRLLLVDELGIEPSPALQELEQAILRHDLALDATSRATVAAVPARDRGTIVVIQRDERALDGLLALAEPLARAPERELILVRLLDGGDDVTAAAAVLAERRADLAARGLAARVAAYTTAAPGLEAASLAAHHAADLLLVEAPEAALATGKLDQDLTVMLERAPCDVAVLAGPPPATAGPVVTPFGGVEHDWSAIEIAAWLARSLRTTLRLLGTEADAAGGRRDASRLLARASLLVQQVIGIATEPVLVRRGEEGVLDAAGDARVLVVGLSDRWRSEGIGATRAALAARAAAPTLFVRRGPRPSGVAPSETLTRFTWTLASHARAQD